LPEPFTYSLVVSPVINSKDELEALLFGAYIFIPAGVDPLSHIPKSNSLELFEAIELGY
jgi:hypothetical protein